MAKKQQIILTHGVGIPNSVGIAKGEVLVRHAENAVDAALYTVLNDETTLVSFPSKDYVDAAKTELGGKITALEGRANKAETAITALNEFKDTTVPATYATKGELASEVKTINDKIGNVSDGTVVGLITAETSARTEAVAGVQKQIDELGNTYATDQELAGAVEILEGQITAAQNAATTKVTEGTDAGNNLTITESTGATGSTFIIGLVDVASASAVTALTERIDAIEDAPYATQGYVTTTVSTEIAKVVAEAPEDFDTLKEIADWISNDTTGAVSMANDIKALKDVTGGYSGENAIKDAIAGVQRQIDELDNTYATDQELAGAVEILEGKITAAQNAATTKVTEGTDAGNNLTITESTGATGSTFIIGLVDVASASAVTALTQRVDTIQGEYVNAVEVTNSTTNKIAASITSNKLALNFESMVIDGGTY